MSKITSKCYDRCAEDFYFLPYLSDNKNIKQCYTHLHIFPLQTFFCDSILATLYYKQENIFSLTTFLTELRYA